MKRILSFCLAAVMLFALCSLCAAADPATFEEEIAALLGEENEGAMFDLAVSSAGYTDSNDAVVKVSLKNDSVESGITVVQFTLKYDAKKLSLVYDKQEDFDGEGAYLLPGVKNANAGKWESLTKLDEENGSVYVKYATTSASAAAKDDGSIVIPFTFKINEGAEGPFAVYIPHASVSGANAALAKFSGNGGYALIAASPEEETAAMLGEENEGAMFELAVSSDGYSKNNVAVVKVTLQNVLSENGLAILEFTLCYDPEKLTLAYNKEDLDDDGAYLLPGVENAEGKRWESLTKLDEENGCIYVDYLTTRASSAVKDDGSIVIPFTFKINEGAEEPFAVYIPHASVNGSDANFNKFKGNGGYVIIAEKQEIEFTVDSGFEADIEEGLITGLAPDTDVKEFLEAIIDSGECVIENPSGSDLIGTGTKITYNGTTYTVVVKGDLDGDGTIQATDYAMVKRAFLGSYDANREQNLAASLTNGVKIEAADYVMIKRHFLGTYKIK